jgi:hypothetical protein
MTARNERFRIDSRLPYLAFSVTGKHARRDTPRGRFLLPQSRSLPWKERPASGRFEGMTKV